jgi:plasmid maintenance system antidote protein VapI
MGTKTPPDGYDDAGVRELLRQRVLAETGFNKREWAKRHGVERTLVVDAINGRIPVPPQLAHALGLRKIGWFVPVADP